jgi:hypothetical protein
VHAGHSLGILLIYVLGALLYWRWVAAIPALLSLLFAACLSAVPESPIWLAGHRGVEPARRALTWLRGGGGGDADAVAAELDDLLEMQERKAASLGLAVAMRNFATRRDVHRPILLVSANMCLVMLTGPHAVASYAVDIIREAAHEPELAVDKYLAAIYVGLVRVAGGIAGIFIIRALPRVRVATVRYFSQFYVYYVRNSDWMILKKS